MLGLKGILRITCVLASLSLVLSDNPYYNYYSPEGFSPLSEEPEVSNEVQTDYLTNSNYGYEQNTNHHVPQLKRRQGTIGSVLQNFNPFNTLRRQFQVPTQEGQVAVRYIKIHIRLPSKNTFCFQIISVFISLAAATSVFYLNDNNLKLKKRVEDLEGKGYGNAIISNCQAVSTKY